MKEFETLITDTHNHIARNFRHVLDSFDFYKNLTFTMYFNSLRKLEETLQAVDTNSNCFMNHKSLFNDAHVNAAGKVTQCVANVHADASVNIPSYMSWFGPTFQTEALKLNLKMLDDVIEKNPVTDAAELAGEVWPKTYENFAFLFRERYFYYANDLYSGMSKYLGRLSIPLGICLAEVEADFESSIDVLRKNLELECN